MNNREMIQRTLERRYELGDKNLEDVLVEMLDAASLVSNPGSKTFKVAGYTSQPDAKVALVNSFKGDEERLLRAIDRMNDSWPVIVRGDGTAYLASGTPDSDVNVINAYDKRWLAIAKTHFQEGFMALNRAVFQPQRIRLPEDGE